MPTLPRPQCSEYGCKAPSVKGSRYCTEHAPAARTNKSERKELDTLYSSGVWREIRAAQLSRAPLCQCCEAEGRIKAAEAVDHVFPWKSWGPNAFRVNIFQSLCAPCHSRKTSLELRGVFRRYSGDGFTDYSAADYPAAVYRQG